jgi:hypothetical protein
MDRAASQHRLANDKSQRFKTEDKDKINIGPDKYNVLN